GLVLHEQNKLDEAVAAYKKATEINPNYASAYNGLGLVLHEQNKLDDAIKVYNKVIDLPEDTTGTPSTTHAVAYNNLGLLHQQQGNLQKAIKFFGEAETIDSEFVYARNNYDEAKRLLTEQENNLASVEDDRQWLPKNDPNVPVKRSIVRITAKSFNSNSRCQGSKLGTGVVIQRQGNRTFILTNRHVIFCDNHENKQGKNIQVEFFSTPPKDRVRMRRNAKLFKATSKDERLDLAVLEITDKLPEDIKPLAISETAINSNMPIKIIGHSEQGGEDNLWSVVIGKIKNYQNQQLEISETAVKHGYSGSPVLDSQNRVLGIVYAIDGRKSGETHNSAFPISEVKKQLSIWNIPLNKR
ncbi:tetratricopeptide repeat protein, partial [Nostoc piscinale]